MNDAVDEAADLSKSGNNRQQQIPATEKFITFAVIVEDRKLTPRSTEKS